ncbi:MAG: hypothetical protein J5685_09640, partial [Clostridiales bacterium]|nr:hypothetical protein [Clostridiales bacterium]
MSRRFTKIIAALISFGMVITVLLLQGVFCLDVRANREVTVKYSPEQNTEEELPDDDQYSLNEATITIDPDDDLTYTGLQ